MGSLFSKGTKSTSTQAANSSAAAPKPVPPVCVNTTGVDGQTIDLTKNTKLLFNTANTTCKITINECDILNAKYVYGGFMLYPPGVTGIIINGTKLNDAGFMRLSVESPFVVELITDDTTITFDTISKDPDLADMLSFMIGTSDVSLDSVIITYNSGQNKQVNTPSPPGPTLTAAETAAMATIQTSLDLAYTININTPVKAGFQNQKMEVEGYYQPNKLTGIDYHTF